MWYKFVRAFLDAGGGSGGTGLAFADEVVQSTMDAAFEDKLKEGAEAFEFQAEVSQYDTICTW